MLLPSRTCSTIARRANQVSVIYLSENELLKLTVNLLSFVLINERLGIRRHLEMHRSLLNRSRAKETLSWVCCYMNRSTTHRFTAFDPHSFSGSLSFRFSSSQALSSLCLISSESPYQLFSFTTTLPHFCPSVGDYYHGYILGLSSGL
jgi:hypothetical protein